MKRGKGGALADLEKNKTGEGGKGPKTRRAEAPVSWRRQDRDTALGSDREAVSVASAEG